MKKRVVIVVGVLVLLIVILALIICFKPREIKNLNLAENITMEIKDGSLTNTGATVIITDLSGDESVDLTNKEFKIDKINFEGLIYEGTSMQTLAKGVGHFTNTPYLEGNVCLAAHNTNSYWAKLHTLSNGDKIQYTCFLGTKEYEVSNVSKISETDWDSLKNTDTNVLTLITCVKGQKDLRLCVQAKEIK